MPLKHTLLGLLILHPRSGYALYRRVEQVTFLLESASLRRIYPTLKQMAEDGLVEYRVEPQEGKPDSKIYSVTDRGEAEFLAWLRQPPEEDPHSLYLSFSRVFFYGMLDKGTLLVRLQDLLATRRQRLQALQDAAIDPPLGPCRDIVDEERVTAVWNLMLDYGRQDIATQIEWLEETIQDIGKNF